MAPQPSPTALGLAGSGPKPRGWLCKKCPAKSFIYVAAGNEIGIFSGSGADVHAIGAITDHISNAYGLFVDAKQNLYVANQGGWVSAYHPRHLQPWIVYAGSISPLYVATDRTGRVYVGNRGGTVSEFPAGQTLPDRTLKTPGSEADGINFDAAGNLYVAYRGRSGNGSIEEFPPNSTSGQILGMHLEGPQGLQLDRLGNIIVAESGNGTIDMFRPGGKRPFQVVQASPWVTQVALTRAEHNIFYSNYRDSTVYVSRYPQDQFRLKLDSGLMSMQGMALSNEAR
ncbi:MAG TPA: hypothetical protein VN936_11095 [Candidatus Acidoferrum sp.]|nr:hypothetical protein [Candidatus Acidoferrum sp.]